ncbi:hypothetical protein LCGC14_2854660, partial [marine sediment metagenome]
KVAEVAVIIITPYGVYLALLRYWPSFVEDFFDGADSSVGKKWTIGVVFLMIIVTTAIIFGALSIIAHKGIILNWQWAQVLAGS